MERKELIGSKVLMGRDNIVSLNEIGVQIKVLLSIEDKENKSEIGAFVQAAINEKLRRELNSEFPRMTIEELKTLHGVTNSEQLFNIPNPPEYICQHAVLVKKKIVSKLGKNLTNNDVEYLLESIEILRKQCENIRTWGKRWKSLAKEAINEKDGCADLLSLKYKNKELYTHFKRTSQEE